MSDSDSWYYNFHALCAEIDRLNQEQGTSRSARVWNGIKQSMTQIAEDWVLLEANLSLQTALSTTWFAFESRMSTDSPPADDIEAQIDDLILEYLTSAPAGQEGEWGYWIEVAFSQARDFSRAEGIAQQEEFLAKEGGYEAVYGVERPTPRLRLIEGGLAPDDRSSRSSTASCRLLPAQNKKSKKTKLKSVQTKTETKTEAKTEAKTARQNATEEDDWLYEHDKLCAELTRLNQDRGDEESRRCWQEVQTDIAQLAHRWSSEDPTNPFRLAHASAWLLFEDRMSTDDPPEDEDDAIVDDIMWRYLLSAPEGREAEWSYWAEIAFGQARAFSREESIAAQERFIAEEGGFKKVYGVRRPRSIPTPSKG